MKAGSLFKPVITGKADTIDGVTGNWIKISTYKNATDRDGNPLPEGTVGWCFGAYTALYTDYYSVDSSVLTPRNSDINKADPDLKTTVLDDAVFYVKRDIIHEETWGDTEVVAYERSRCYFEKDGNIYLVAAEYGTVNFSGYTFTRTTNGYLVEKRYYTPFGKSDGAEVIEYRYITSDGSTWYDFDLGSACMSVTEWNGESIWYKSSDTGGDYVIRLDEPDTFLYRLNAGSVDEVAGVRVYGALYEDCDPDSTVLLTTQYSVYGIVIEESGSWWLKNFTGIDPKWDCKVTGDFKYQWVKVMLLDSGETGWYQKLVTIER